MNTDELTEIYIKALDARAIKDRPQRASAFRQFHHFHQNQFGLESVDWYEVEPNIDKQAQSINANIISMPEYESALLLLENDNDCTARDKRLNQVLLILCYRAGLRSGEATHLKTADIDINNWIIHVRTQVSHRLKTLRSNRRIPVKCLLSNVEKKIILTLVDEAKSNLSTQNNWLFCDMNNTQCLVERSKHIKRVTEALKIATGDITIRLHNARHSFANYLLMTLVELKYPKVIRRELDHWSRSNNKKLFIEELSKTLLSTAHHRLNTLYAISLAMGHSTPKTTLSNYIHCLDLMLLAQDQKQLFKAISIPSLANKINIERTNVNKILQRGTSAQYGLQPLIERLSFHDGDFQEIILPKRALVNLSDMTLSSSTCCYHCFNNIERIIRATEDNYSIINIENKYQLSHAEIQSTINKTIEIQKITAYHGTRILANSEYLSFSHNQQKTDIISQYIHQSEFQALLKKAAKLTHKQLRYLSHIFIDSFDKRYGIVVSHQDTHELVLIAYQLGYKTIIKKKLTTLRSSFGLRKGHHIKFVAIANSKKHYSRRSYNDHRFTHCLFLIAVFTFSLKEDANEYTN